MLGFLLAAASVMTLFCIYALIFRRAAIQALPNLLRFIFWVYFIAAAAILIWGLIKLFSQ